MQKIGEFVAKDVCNQFAILISYLWDIKHGVAKVTKTVQAG
jgi:hypothetical protein